MWAFFGFTRLKTSNKAPQPELLGEAEAAEAMGVAATHGHSSRLGRVEHVENQTDCDDVGLAPRGAVAFGADVEMLQRKTFEWSESK